MRPLPLARESTVRVNEVEVWERAAHGERRYPKSWISELDLAATHGAVVVQIGRTRWKSEKEQVNVQKNHG